MDYSEKGNKFVSFSLLWHITGLLHGLSDASHFQLAIE